MPQPTSQRRCGTCIENLETPPTSVQSSDMSRRLRPRRDGLSLLEVILSIAILGTAMAAIGQLYYLGYRSALQSRYRSEGNLIADTKMAELASGVLPLESTGGQIDELPVWTYQIEVQQSLLPGLFLASVTVSRNDNIPVSITLKRFITDPDYEPEEDQE